MDDRELYTTNTTDDITQPLPDPTQQNEQGLSENTSIEGLPTPEVSTVQPEPAQPENPAPQPDTLCCAAPETVMCPRCGNLIPYENFCPVCTFSLRGLPPAQPTPPRIPVYGAMPPVMAQPQHHAAFAPPPPPPPPTAWQAPPPSYPPVPNAPREGAAKWPVIVGIVMGGLMLLLQLITLIVVAYGVSQLVGGNAPDNKGDLFFPDDESQEYQLPDNILPQYFIGDTVVNNDISYNFDYSLAEETDTEGTSLVVIGVTFKNNSGEAFTLTPSLFRLEDVTGNPCEFSPTLGGVSAKDVLERTVLMPGETVSKLLLYSTSGGEYDYLPLYVLDQTGNELFYVYLSLYS